MELMKEKWGLIDGNQIHLYRILDEKTGFEASFTEVGASIVRVKMPDKDGNVSDIHYGRKNAQEIQKNEDDGYLGSIVGRVASFLYFASFELDGEKYEVTKNMFGNHSKHGGEHGFNTQIWTMENIEETDEKISITFSYLSKDGEEGYPGNLDIKTKYFVSKNMEIGWEITATTDKPTIINIVNHAYWNLEPWGETIDRMKFQINGNTYYKAKIGKIALETIGDILHIKKKHQKLPYKVRNLDELKTDLTEPHSFSEIFDMIGELDGTFILNKTDNKMNPESKAEYAAKLISESTGRSMEVYTTEPAAIVYTGNYMHEVIAFGKKCEKHQAVCIEAGRLENGIKISKYKDWVILRPEKTFYHKTIHKFSLIT